MTEAALLAREPLIAAATPTLAVLVTSPHHMARAREMLELVHDLARPDALVGCLAEAVVAGPREVEGEPAVVVWLSALPQPAETFHMAFLSTGSGGVFAGYRFDHAGTDLHRLFPDPYGFPTHLLLAHLNAHAPGTPVMGGLVSGAAKPGRTRLFCDGKVLESGVVGVRLPGLEIRPVDPQGCRPIGDPFTVTGASGATLTDSQGALRCDCSKRLLLASRCTIRCWPPVGSCSGWPSRSTPRNTRMATSSSGRSPARTRRTAHWRSATLSR